MQTKTRLVRVFAFLVAALFSAPLSQDVYAACLLPALCGFFYPRMSRPEAPLKTQMLRIIGCSNSSYWYAGKVGQVFRHMGYDQEASEFITREPSGYINIIKAADAEVVDVTPAAPTCAVPTDKEPSIHYRLVLDVEFLEPAQLRKFNVDAIGRAVHLEVSKMLSLKHIAARVSI